MTRKFTFLLMALLALAGFRSWGQENVLSEGFESSTFPPDGWTAIHVSGDNSWTRYENTFHDGTACARVDDIYHDDYLITPQLTPQVGESLSFYLSGGNWVGYDGTTLTVEVSTTDTDASSFTTVLNTYISGAYATMGATFANKIIDLSLFVGQNIYIAFHAIVNNGSEVLIDDVTGVSLAGANTCPAPTGLTASNITATGATISWNDNDAESYDLAYGVASTFDLSNPATYTLRDGLTSTSVPLSGLTTEAEYKCAVKAHCSDEEESAWSEVITFIASDKIIVDFESGIPSGWTRIDADGDGNNWDIKTDFHNSGSNALCSESYRSSFNPNNFFVSPQFTLGEGAGVSFYVYNYSNAYKDHIGVGISTTGNSANDFVMIWEGTPANQWNKIEVDLSDYADQSVYIAFRHYDSYDRYRIYIDDITIDLGETAEKYTITLTQPEAGGSIDADPKTDVAAGTLVTLSATPATGYELGEWTVTNVTTSETVTVTNNTFEMPDSDVNVTATFEALVPHTVTIAEGIQHGTVSLFPDAPQEYMAGATVYLDVTADDGYFYPREGEITVTDADGNNIDIFINGTDYSFIMPNSDVTVWAVFNLYYGVQVDTGIVGGHIDVTDDLGHSISGIPFFTAGADVYFIPIPGDDYEYVEQSVSVYEWDLEQHEIGNPIDVDYNSGFAHITMPESHIFVTATFNRIRYSVTQQITNPAGSGYFYIENAEHIEVGTPVVISYIEAYWDYQFASVTITRNDDQTTVEAYPYYGDYVFYMPDSDVTVTVNFEKIPSYTVTINETEHGTVSIYGAESSYHAGEVVSLVADPDEGYIISATEITITPAEGDPFHPTYDAYNSVYNFYMPASNVTITAAFREIQTYTINYYVNGELEGSAQCSEIEAIDIHAYYPYVSGVLFFEGWSVAPIGTYLTDKPAIIGEDEYPTHDYDLHAVFSYSETLPATSKDGETWVEVTSPTDLSNGDQVIIVSGNFVMCDRSSSGSGEFPQGSISIYNNEITELPDNAVILTAIEFPEFWQFYFNDAFNGYSGLADYIGSYLVPSGAFGTDCSTWVIEQNGSSVAIKDTQFESYITLYSNRFTCSSYGAKAQLFKKYNPFITNTYYMTSVLTDGEVAENTTAKNIIISSINNINVKDGATLTMDANGLFRNELFSNFVFEDGAQFYYTGTETVNATFEKEVSGYTGDNDNYYLIANPTDYKLVGNLYDNLYDLYTFNPEETLEWQNEHDSLYVEQRIGYLYANSEDITLQFTGNLTPAGETEIALVKAEAVAGIEFPGFNLIGNPYACNAYVDGYNFYKMVGGELVINEGTATVAPCEGFFVEATAAGQSVTLSTTVPEPASMLSLSVSQNRGNVIDRAIVNFDGRSDLHKFMLNPAHTNISLAKHGEEFAAVSAGSTSGEIPVSFKAEKNGSYTITVNTENVNAHYIHLIDNLTGADVDLLATPSYTFNASTTDYAYRFKLVFSMTDIEENESNANSFAYISNGNLVIDNIEGEATMQIIDMLGRVVSTETVSGSYNKALGLNAGLYIINLNGTTQKIVVK